MWSQCPASADLAWGLSASDGGVGAVRALPVAAGVGFMRSYFAASPVSAVFPSVGNEDAPAGALGLPEAMSVAVVLPLLCVWLVDTAVDILRLVTCRGGAAPALSATVTAGSGQELAVSPGNGDAANTDIEAQARARAELAERVAAFSAARAQQVREDLQREYKGWLVAVAAVVADESIPLKGTAQEAGAAQSQNDVAALQEQDAPANTHGEAQSDATQRLQLAGQTPPAGTPDAAATPADDATADAPSREDWALYRLNVKLHKAGRFVAGALSMAVSLAAAIAVGEHLFGNDGPRHSDSFSGNRAACWCTLIMSFLSSVCVRVL